MRALHADTRLQVSRSKLGERADLHFGARNSNTNRFPAIIPEGQHPIPSRTRKLSPPGPMVLQGGPCGRVGRRREIFAKAGSRTAPRLFHFCGSSIAKLRPKR